MDVGAGLLGVVQVAEAKKAEILGAEYVKERDRYANDATKIQQDALGKEARQYVKKDGYQIWVKELTGGRKAIGLFNTSDKYLVSPAKVVYNGILGSAPCFSKSNTISRLRGTVAAYNALNPDLLFKFTFAPASINIRT